MVENLARGGGIKDVQQGKVIADKVQKSTGDQTITENPAAMEDEGFKGVIAIVCKRRQHPRRMMDLMEGPQYRHLVKQPVLKEADEIIYKNQRQRIADNYTGMGIVDRRHRP